MVRAAPEPFRAFADNAEVPLAICRDKMCAVHHLIEWHGDPGPEILDAVRTLVVETWMALEKLHEAHAAAFKAYQDARP